MITVAILTKDNQDTIAATLDSIKGFDEALLLDTGSCDRTLEIAKNYSNVTIHTAPFCGFGKLRNIAADLAKNDWILALDADEALSPALALEIGRTPLSPDCVYLMPFHNFYNGRHIKWCGWHPETHLRLYNRRKTGFDMAFVHEGLRRDGLRIIDFKEPVFHYPYRSTADFLRKMQTYSTLFAEQNAGKKKASLFTAIRHGSFAFFKSYILKKGFLGGREGFIISVYNGNTAFYKYLKLAEK